MARKKTKCTELSVFKGREAKLNRAIFQILALMSPLTVYGVHKQVIRIKGMKNTRYSSTNKRVRHLSMLRLVRKIGSEKTQAGFQASLYELSARAYLAILIDSINFQEMLLQMDELEANTMLATIIDMLQLRSGQNH